MPPSRFHINISRAAGEAIQDVFRKARLRGQEQEVIRAAAKIEEGLIWFADELGESRFPLKMMGELRVVVIGPLGAVYSVSRTKREVYLGRVRLLGLHRDGQGNPKPTSS